MSAPQPLDSEVIEIPVKHRAGLTGPLALLGRRFNGSQVIDPWGLDFDAVEVASWLAALRWKVRVQGIDHIPSEGPAVLVCNRRSGLTEPLVLVSALTRAVERHVRPVGCPDIDPLGTVAQRLGAISARDDEVTGALRAGHLVALPASRALGRFQLGRIPLDLLESAVALDVPVLPVAVTGWELGRSWNIRVGAPVEYSHKKGPRAVAELGVRVSAELEGLLSAAEECTLWHRLRH